MILNNSPLDGNPRVAIDAASSFVPTGSFSILSLFRSILLGFLLFGMCYKFGFLPMLSVPLAYFSFKKRSRFNLFWSLISKQKFFWSKKDKRPVFFFGDPEPETIIQKQQNLKYGIGAQIYSAGTIYYGEFLDGNREGRGVFSILGERLFEGDWSEGVYDGYGFEQVIGSGEFRGSFIKGEKHGYGSYKCVNGDRYEGEWRYDRRYGTGVYMFSDGNTYFGEFKHGMKHGVGVYRFRNGDVYIGEYFLERFAGFGMYQFANGDYYEGSWHEGLMHGYGAYTRNNGEVISGIWNSGSLIATIPSYEDCIRNCIKATHAIVERCDNMEKFDDQVIMSVSLANDSILCARLASDMAIEKLNMKFLAKCIVEIQYRYDSVKSLALTAYMTYQGLRKRWIHSALSSEIKAQLSAISEIVRNVIIATRVTGKKVARSRVVKKSMRAIRRTGRNWNLASFVKAVVAHVKGTRRRQKEECLHLN